MDSKYWQRTGEEVTFKMGYTSSLALLRKLVNVALHRTNIMYWNTGTSLWQLWLQYILVTVCTDIVTVRIRIA